LRLGLLVDCGCPLGDPVLQKSLLGEMVVVCVAWQVRR
jgi:hypothetical protein